jgi:hypothetical protein
MAKKGGEVEGDFVAAWPGPAEPVTSASERLKLQPKLKSGICTFHSNICGDRLFHNLQA